MKALALIFGLILISSTVFGFSGHITSNTTWEEDIIITGDTWVDEGVTLTIMPGVIITIPKVDQNADGLGDIDFIINGRLLCQGTPENRVVFKSLEVSPQHGDWVGITFSAAEDQSLSIISYLDIINSITGILVNGRNLTINSCYIGQALEFGIHILSSAGTTSMNSSIIELGSSIGVRCAGGDFQLYNSIVANCLGNGIEIYTDNILLDSSRSISNGGNGLVVSQSSNSTVYNCSFNNNLLNGISLSNGNATITNSSIDNNQEFGVLQDSGNWNLDLCNITNNGFYGISTGLASISSITNSNILENCQSTSILEFSVPSNELNTNRGLSDKFYPPRFFMDDIVSIYCFRHFYYYWADQVYSMRVHSPTNNVIFNNSDQGNSYHTWEDYGSWVSNTAATANYWQIEMVYPSQDTSNNSNCAIQSYRTQISTNTQLFADNETIEINANFNWWGQLTGIDQLVAQVNPGTVTYETYAVQYINDAGSDIPNTVPAITVITPDTLLIDPSDVLIEWEDRDIDNNANISLYYDDSQDQTGTLIMSGLEEDSSDNSFIWDLSEVAFGTYWVYAVIDDGVNTPVVSYSPGKVLVGPITVAPASNAYGTAGNEAFIPIEVINTISEFDIIAFQFTLSFNPSLLEFIDISQTETLCSEWSVFSTSTSPGQVSVNGFSTSPLASGGTLINIVVNVNPTANNQETTILNFADFVFNEGLEGVVLEDGLFTVINQFNLEGSVLYYNNDEPIETAILNLTGDYQDAVQSQSDGSYSFPPIYSGTYTVCPEYDAPVSVEVASPYDASMVARNSLLMLPFTGDQQIAGDVTGDGNVSVYDAALIAQYSVGIIESFPAGSWVFSPECNTYTLNENYPDEIFYGIAIGDPSGNWTHSERLHDTEPEAVNLVSSSRGQLSLPISYTEEFSSCLVKYEVNTDELRLVDIILHNALSDFESVSKFENGILTYACYGTESVQVTAPAITLIFETINGQSHQQEIQQFLVMFNETIVSDEEVTAVHEESIPTQVTLHRNIPNPFNPSTLISFDLPTATFVTLKVYNISGELVSTLLKEEKSAGTHQCSFNARGLSSGVYFTQLNVGGLIKTQKMVLIK